MNEADEIENLKKVWAVLIRRASDLAASRICEVISVDKVAKTCRLMYHADDVIYEDCRLCSVIDDGENISVIYPKVGSFVQAIPSEKNTSVWLVIMVHQSDGIELNGNKYSMVKAEEMQQQINKLNDIVNALLQVINATPGIPEPGSNAPSALQAAFKTALVGKPIADFTNIVNENVKHG